MKKIIVSFIFSLCVMHHLQVISMQQQTQTVLVEAKVINLSFVSDEELKNIFPGNYQFNRVEYPITTWIG